MFSYEAEVKLVGRPTDEFDTLPLLAQRRIEYPDFYQDFPFPVNGHPAPSNPLDTLDELIWVWSVTGYHQQKSELKVGLLLGGYKETCAHSVFPLGRRVGLTWVSPILPAK